jgi:hypothetical protein
MGANSNRWVILDLLSPSAPVDSKLTAVKTKSKATAVEYHLPITEKLTELVLTK